MATKTKAKLTEDQKLRRRAIRKAEEANRRAKEDAGPLYESQIPAEEFTTPTEEYWKIRKSFADLPRGRDAAYLAGIEFKVDLMIIRNLARRVMPSADFALAENKSRDFGPIMDFWKNILLGKKRIVIDVERISHGWKPVFRTVKPVCCEHGCSRCEEVILTWVEKIDLKERRVWPDQGYQPPIATQEELDAYLALPAPRDFEGAVQINFQERT